MTSSYVRTFILPVRMSHTMRRSTIPRSIRLWDSLPDNITDAFSRNSEVQIEKTYWRSKIYSKLSISHKKEIFWNQERCDLLFRSHFFAHNFANMPDPQCQCGHRSQTTSHVFFTCPLLNDVRRTYLTEIRSILNIDVASLETLSLAERVHLLLHGGSDLSTVINKAIVSKTADFLELAILVTRLLTIK
jgi:hypothetical protein